MERMVFQVLFAKAVDARALLGQLRVHPFPEGDCICKKTKANETHARIHDSVGAEKSTSSLRACLSVHQPNATWLTRVSAFSVCLVRLIIGVGECVYRGHVYQLFLLGFRSNSSLSLIFQYLQ